MATRLRFRILGGGGGLFVCLFCFPFCSHLHEAVKELERERERERGGGRVGVCVGRGEGGRVCLGTRTAR